MHLEANAPRQRIAYVYKQYPKQPFIALDLIRTVARRLDFDQWRYLVVQAAKQADQKLYEDMEDVALLTQDGSRIAVTPSMWQRHMSAREGWIEHRAGGAEKFDGVYHRVVGAIVEMVGEMDEFQKNSPFDPFIPWAAREMAKFAKNGDDESYDELGDYLADEKSKLVEWYVKKKPDLMKLSFGEVAGAVEGYEDEIEPETVFEWDDGWRVVHLTTPSQLNRAGTELKNCLRKDSSYHEGFCQKIDQGKADYYALIGADGGYRVAVEWLKGEKSPEQVYAYDNKEPTGKDEERVNEWIESKGGAPSNPIKQLRGDAREIADFINENDSYMDDEDIASYAVDWSGDFSAENAIAWIKLVGAYGKEEADALDALDVSPSDAEELPEWIWEYLRENSYRNAALKDVVNAAFMFSKMLPNEEKRDGYRLPPSSQLAFPFRGEPKARPLPPLPGKVKVPAEDRALFHQAWAWVQSGWDDRDYYDEAIEWWVRHFRPDEAYVYAFDLGQHGKSNQTEVPYDVAEALRDHGINAWEVEDAAPYVSGTLNLHNAEELIAQVEKAKKTMLPNRARRISRPRNRR